MATAFLGPPGTFSEEAALVHAGGGDTLLPFDAFPAVVAAVETGLAAEAVLPIENSIEGAVSGTLDLLIHETPLRIRAEIVLPIRHFLVTAPGTALADLRVVASKPEALAQCRRFLDRCLPGVRQEAALSTAAAVRDAAVGGDTARAGIGPRRAADLYGGQILAHDIQDVRANLTRFVVLAAADHPPTGDDKTSLAFTIPANVPGSLHAILGLFAAETLQLTKIESRPTKERLGEYVFLVDLEGHRLDPPLARVLDRVAAASTTLKVFGSYPRWPHDPFRDLAEPP